jgi:NADH-quinone oxidoreductase subunit J
MSGEMIAFFILALIAIAGAVLMLNLQRVIHMVLSLVFTFLSIAGIYILLSAEFVAVVQVLIYSGAITIIMLFGIMLTSHNEKNENPRAPLKNILTATGVIGFFIVMYFAIRDLTFGEQATNLHVNNTENIGISLFTEYVIPFELTSVLLLVALVGSIVLARRDDEKEEAGTDE